MADQTPTPTTSDRITVTLHPTTRPALDALVAEHALSSSDTVNRALRLYAFVSDAQRDGGQVLVQRPDGATERVVFL